MIKWRLNGAWFYGYLDDVLYVPEFNKNLYLTNVSTARGLRVIFNDNRVEIVFKQTKEVVIQGAKFSNNLCAMDFEVMLPNAKASACSFQHLHESLGHVNKTRLQRMILDRAVNGLGNIKIKNFFS